MDSAYIRGKETIARIGRQKSTQAPRGHNRLPPGQRLVNQFPILDLGIRPSPEEAKSWSLIIDGAVEYPQVFSLAQLKALPQHTQTRDFHCVTRWSTYDHEWVGVLLRELAERVKPTNAARILLFHGYDGYTTNVSLEDALTDEGMIAWELDEDELPIMHGGPLRGLIPHLYGWKSTKFLTRIEFLEEDEPGFWELRGYHPHGDPWSEERYSD